MILDKELQITLENLKKAHKGLVAWAEKEPKFSHEFNVSIISYRNKNITPDYLYLTAMGYCAQVLGVESKHYIKNYFSYYLFLKDKFPFLFVEGVSSDYVFHSKWSKTYPTFNDFMNRLSSLIKHLSETKANVKTFDYKTGKIIN